MQRKGVAQPTEEEKKEGFAAVSVKNFREKML